MTTKAGKGARDIGVGRCPEQLRNANRTRQKVNIFNLSLPALGRVTIALPLRGIVAWVQSSTPTFDHHMLPMSLEIDFTSPQPIFHLSPMSVMSHVPCILRGLAYSGTIRGTEMPRLHSFRSVDFRSVPSRGRPPFLSVSHRGYRVTYIQDLEQRVVALHDHASYLIERRA